MASPLDGKMIAVADYYRTRSAIVPPPARRGLSRVESAQYVGVSPSFFDRLVQERKMPAPKRIHSRTVWDVRALDSAFEALEGEDPSAVSPYD